MLNTCRLVWWEERYVFFVMPVQNWLIAKIANGNNLKDFMYVLWYSPD